MSNVNLKRKENKSEKHPIKARELNHNERIIEKVAGRKRKKKEKINFKNNMKIIKLKLTTVFGLDRYHYQAWPRTCS